VGGAITAGKFLENFVGDHAWVHLDIASTAWHDGTLPRLNEEYSPEHATGVGVRLLARWMRDFKKPAWTRKEPAEAEAKPEPDAKPSTGRPRVSVS
jgi:hypothetical protein